MRSSEMYANDIDLTPGERWQARCQRCGRWRTLHRSRLKPHRTKPGGQTRCPGSNAEVRVDEHPAEWYARLQHAQRHTQMTTGRPDWMPDAPNPEQVVVR